MRISFLFSSGHVKKHSTLNTQQSTTKLFYFSILNATINIYYFFAFYYFLFSPTLLGYSLVSICIFFILVGQWSVPPPSTAHANHRSSSFSFSSFQYYPISFFSLFVCFFGPPGFILLRLIPDFPRWTLSKVKCCSYWNTDPTINQK